MSEAPAVPSKLMVIIPGLRDSTMRSVVDRVRRERGDYRVEFVPHGIKVFSRTRTLAKSVAELAHKMALACAADGWVAAHLCHLVHVHRHQAYFRADAGRSVGRFASSVSCTDDNDIIKELCIH